MKATLIITFFFLTFFPKQLQAQSCKTWVDVFSLTNGKLTSHVISTTEKSVIDVKGHFRCIAGPVKIFTKNKLQKLNADLICKYYSGGESFSTGVEAFYIKGNNSSSNIGIYHPNGSNTHNISINMLCN